MATERFCCNLSVKYTSPRISSGVFPQLWLGGCLMMACLAGSYRWEELKRTAEDAEGAEEEREELYVVRNFLNLSR
ncbi:MAG TPA: hypothetical protein VE956_11085 [Nodularia sp. (in: cyanobacteria)]|nr:hypothetical protein [Nodularia sp. (in: cyanobacteria)]